MLQCARAGFLYPVCTISRAQRSYLQNYFILILKTTVDQLPPFIFGAAGACLVHGTSTNPYNPFGTSVGVQGTLAGIGDENQVSDTNFLRALVGARGGFFDNWHWEVAAWDAQDVTDSRTPISPTMPRFKCPNMHQILLWLSTRFYRGPRGQRRFWSRWSRAETGSFLLEHLQLTALYVGRLGVCRPAR